MIFDESFLKDPGEKRMVLVVVENIIKSIVQSSNDACANHRQALNSLESGNSDFAAEIMDSMMEEMLVCVDLCQIISLKKRQYEQFT